jgi:hypothetical protein
MMTPNDIRAEYPNFQVVKYNKVSQKFEPVSSIPEIAVYQVIKGIEELELMD